MKNTLKSVSFFVLLLVLFGFVSCKAESGDDASIPVTTQEKPTNQPQPTPQPQAGTYIVQHYQQDTTGDGYTLFETERLTGTAGEQTKAAAKTYEHFSAKTFSQAAIKTDGSTVIRIDYDREIITLTFNPNGGTWDDGTRDDKVISGRYGASSIFEEYPKKIGCGTTWNSDPQAIFTANTTYTAQYEDGMSNYKVKHYLQNLEDDNYPDTPFKFELKTGRSDSQIEVEAKDYEGYETTAVTQATIYADGSTVVEIRYARKRYAVSFETNGAGTVTSQTVKYGGKVTEPATLTKTGYNFKGWFVSTDGGTTLADTTFDFANATITDDVALYAKWEIITFTVTFDSKGGSPVASQTVEYGKKASEPSEQTRNPYDFLGWFISTDGGTTLADTAFDFDTAITENVALYAKWEIRANADNVASKIAAMTESDVVVVTGEISASTLDTIKNAINGKTFGVGIDLSRTNGVTSIGRSTFADCTGLTFISLPNEVMGIEDFAFSGCSGLKSINLPSRMTSIGVCAFKGCCGLTSIELPNDLTSIGGYAFNECTGLTKIVIPSGVTGIERGTFQSCTKLKKVKIPNSVKNIDDWSFDKCSELKDIELPEELTSIGQHAFRDCSEITSIDLPSGVTRIESRSFSGCGKLTNIKLHNEVTSIGDLAFYECSSLMSIKLPSGIESIGQWTFGGCKGLTIVEIPDRVTSLGKGAFEECIELTSIKIPNCTISFEDRVFNKCIKLMNITFAGTVEQWNAIEKGYQWKSDVPATKVVCSDGEVSL